MINDKTPTLDLDLIAKDIHASLCIEKFNDSENTVDIVVKPITVVIGYSDSGQSEILDQLTKINHANGAPRFIEVHRKTIRHTMLAESLFKGSCIVISHPEAFVHPTAQLELGSYFAHVWLKFGIGSVIETHSQNLLLRLRRLCANGTLNYKHISVVFCTKDEGDIPIVKNINVGNHGELSAGLPMIFFGADIEEGLLLGARS